MCDETGVGVCRCRDKFNGTLFVVYSFWWAEVRVYFCERCDGLTVEILANNSERVPARTLCDIFNDGPGGRSIIVLDASWVEGLAKIIQTYVKQADFNSN